MKVVKIDPKLKKKLNDKTQVELNRDANKMAIKTYLYRKEMCEKYNEKLSIGLSIYGERYDELKDSNKPADKVEALELLEKLEDLSVEHRNNTQSYKYVERKLEQLTKGEDSITFDPTEFEALKAEAAATAENELYESTDFLPADYELPELIKKYQDGIAVMEARIEEISNSSNTKDQVELFELTQQVITDKKMHARKVDHYQNKFLPEYKKDMELYEKYFMRYMARAKIFSKYTFDPRLNEMLKKYNSNEHTKQYTWQFWTALRFTVDAITLNLSQRDPKTLHANLKEHTRLIIAK